MEKPARASKDRHTIDEAPGRADRASGSAVDRSQHIADNKGQLHDLREPCHVGVPKHCANGVQFAADSIPTDLFALFEVRCLAKLSTAVLETRARSAGWTAFVAGGKTEGPGHMPEEPLDECAAILRQAGFDKGSCVANADDLQRAAYDCCFLESYQGTYWIAASVLLCISFVSLLRLAFEWKVNAEMRRPPITFFYMMLGGDVIFVASFLPFHLRNVLRLFSAGHAELADFGAFCKISWLGASLSITLMLCGGVLISSYPYRVLLLAMQRAHGGSYGIIATTPRMTAIAIGGAGLWYATGAALDQIGPYRGLYCAAQSYANLQGVFLLLYPTIAFSAMCAYYLKAYKAMKGAAQRTSDRNVGRAAQRIMYFGLIMISSFVVTWGPLILTAICNLAGVRVPIQFEMFAGLIAKTKGFVDMCIMLRFPHVRSRGVQPLTERKTAQKSCSKPHTTSSSPSSVLTRPAQPTALDTSATS